MAHPTPPNFVRCMQRVAMQQNGVMLFGQTTSFSASKPTVKIECDILTRRSNENC